MNGLRSLFLLIACSVCCSVSVAGGDEWFEKDSTGKLKEIISDFRENYERVKAERRAFVCEGTSVRNDRGGVKVADIRYIACYDKSVAFIANSFLDANTNTLIERWVQQLTSDGKLYRRLGPFHADVFPDLTDEDEIKEARKEVLLLSPLDNSILPYQYATSYPPEMPADAKLTKGKLIKAEFAEHGDIVQTIQRDGGIFPVRDEIRWSRVEGSDMYAPIRFEFSKVATEEEKERLIPRTIVKTEWTLASKHVVPTRMAIVGFKPKSLIELDLAIEYRFGPEIGKPPVIEPLMADWREPIRVMFKQEWQRRGGPVPLIHSRMRPVPR